MFFLVGMSWVDLGVSIHGTPIPGWFTMQKPLKWIKMDDLRAPPF